MRLIWTNLNRFNNDYFRIRSRFGYLPKPYGYDLFGLTPTVLTMIIFGSDHKQGIYLNLIDTINLE
jgi:hypothetical protein